MSALSSPGHGSGRPRPVLVLDVAGLTPRLLASMPRLGALARRGFEAALEPVLPAVTCPVQATLLTGVAPSTHGVVGNGWYFRDLGEVLFWRQHNALVTAEKVWETARRRVPGYRVANLCWWYAMGAATDVVVTPRPVYHADGRKSPDCYTIPADLHDELTAALGPFPLFQYWGPGAGLASSRWIADAAELVLARGRPDLTLVYIPHLDYDLQRFGPDGPQAAAAAVETDDVAGKLAEEALARDICVIVVSEYGITPVSRPVHINRHLREAGLLRVYRQRGMEYLDPWTSAAFAVADHQVAHVYVKDAATIGRVHLALEELPGVDMVLDEDGKRAAGLAHERAGELVVVAEPGSWFTYHYWLDDSTAPDFARTVDIHRKPGYDPAELFMDPGDRLVKARAGLTLARKRLGFRYTMSVVPLDASCVRGSHGRLPAQPDEGPVVVCSDATPARDRIDALEFKSFLLEVAGLAPSGSQAMQHRRGEVT